MGSLVAKRLRTYDYAGIKGPRNRTREGPVFMMVVYVGRLGRSTN